MAIRRTDDILSYTLARGGGTFEAGTLLPFEPTVGYAVAMAAGSAAVVDILDFHESTAVRVAQEFESSFVGTWIEAGRVHVDPVQYVRDLDRAIKLGRERGQVAIYGFAEREVIEL